MIDDEQDRAEDLLPEVLGVIEPTEDRLEEQALTDDLLQPAAAGPPAGNPWSDMVDGYPDDDLEADLDEDALTNEVSSPTASLDAVEDQDVPGLWIEDGSVDESTDAAGLSSGAATSPPNASADGDAFSTGSLASIDMPVADRLRAADGVIVHGHLETVVDGQISGWATLSVRGVDHPLVTVRIVDEAGDLIAGGVAADFRGDVQEAGLGSGWCGFDFAVPLPTSPATRALALEVEHEGGWRRAARHSLSPQAEPTRLQPPSLLQSFAEADAGGGTVGRGGLHFGRGVWLQASKAVVDKVTARLQLVSAPEADQGDRTAVLRVEPRDDTHGRVDIRLALGDHSRFVQAEWLAIDVFGRAGTQQAVRLNVHDHRGRTTLGDFVVQSHTWSTLHVKVPAHRCSAEDLEGGAAVIWLELVLDVATPLDLSAPRLSGPGPDDLFECLHVQAQGDLFSPATDVRAPTATPFSVVIPFHGKAAYTASCALSVLANSWAPPEIILIDDGSPHPESARRILESLPGPVRVIRSEINRGYTASVNAGVRAATHEVVVILNNDTRVTPGWDNPLIVALEDPEVFAAGPLSNAASYQSVPILKEDGHWAVNTYGKGVTPEALARALRDSLAGRTVDLPILNGFCYAVRRSQFLDLDGLDETAFPHGYGEEVDLMLRARAAGLRNVVTPDSFVYHYKSVTFGGKRAELSKQGNAVVKRRWGSQLSTAVQQMDADPAFAEVRSAVTGVLAQLDAGGTHG